ncbi:MAG: YbaY family lipoprotein [Woeseiaceae bacterium]
MFRTLLYGILALLVSACSETGTPPAANAPQAPDNSLMRVISGDVLYRERIALPPGAIVKVMLEDQSRMDAPATVLTEYTHKADGPPPYAFRLVINPSAIDERMRYGLRAARIEHEGKLLFTSTEHIDPFEGEPGERITIVVSRTGG